MRMCLAVLAVVLLLFCGCGPHMITLTELSDFTEPNADLAGREVQLVMKDGRETRAQDVRLGPVETSWLDLAARERRAVASADVSFVKLRKPGRGALKGLLYGGGGGAAVGGGKIVSPSPSLHAAMSIRTLFNAAVLKISTISSMSRMNF